MHTGLRRLRYFITLSDTLNFRRSADTLGMTQPALSRAIALLEQDIGTRLFDRSGREVSLTPAGQAFALSARTVLESLDGAVLQARRIADGHAGQLVIGYTDTAVTGCLPDIVQGFRARFPAVRVQLRQGYTHQQRRWLEEGQLDVAFMTGPNDSADREAITVQQDRFVALLPKGNTLASHASITLGDLASEPFVLGDPEHWSVYNEHLLRLCAAIGFEPAVIQSAPDSRGIIGLVSCGMGVSVQTESLTRDGDRRVAVRHLDDCRERIITQAVWNTRFESAPKQRLVEYLREHVIGGRADR